MRFSIMARLTWAVFCLHLFVSGRAHAQMGGHWYVLPYGIESSAEAASIADRVHTQLQDRERTVVSNHEARDRYVIASRTAVSLEGQDLEKLIKEGQAALEHVAFGRHSAAQRSVREALDRAERALETLNRKTETARRVLDACLILVRSELGQDHRERALETAMRCRRLVPDVSPSQTTHPASVIGVVAEAENKLRRLQVGRLEVNSTPTDGCSVYINGRHLGVTPFVLDRAAEGAYRVQVECDKVEGRVHEVTLGEKPVSLTVDAMLDRALGSEPRLTLNYADAKLARSFVVGHATTIGRQIRADDIVLVHSNVSQLTLTRVQISQGRAIAEVTIRRTRSGVGGGFSEADIDRGVEALLAGKTLTVQPTQAPKVPKKPPGTPLNPFEDGSLGTDDELEPEPLAAEPEALPIKAPDEPVASVPIERAQRVRRAGYALGGLGVATLLTGWGFEIRKNTLRDEIRKLAVISNDKERQYDRASAWTALGIPGAALLTAAVPMALPKTEGVPLWSYGAGAAGLGLMVWGVAEYAMRNRCIAPAVGGFCLERRDKVTRANLLVLSGTPLLAVPITHALRMLLSKESDGVIAPEVVATDNAVVVSAEGSF